MLPTNLIVYSYVKQACRIWSFKNKVIQLYWGQFFSLIEAYISILSLLMCLELSEKFVVVVGGGWWWVVVVGSDFIGKLWPKPSWTILFWTSQHGLGWLTAPQFRMSVSCSCSPLSNKGGGGDGAPLTTLSVGWSLASSGWCIGMMVAPFTSKVLFSIPPSRIVVGAPLSLSLSSRYI